ncbi:MAG: response regulator [Thermodesulfobacteriota bacterium]
MPHKILLVDDEPHVAEALKRTLHREPFEILSAGSAKEALQILAREPIDVVISDEMMPGMSGSEFLAVVYRNYPEIIRIMLTGHANLNVAVRAINEGHIYRFLMKPCNEQEIRITIRQAIQQKELAEKSRQLLRKVKQQNLILQRMEKEYPGIAKVERDSHGAIIVDDSAFDLDTLIEQMRTELGL